MTLWPRQAAILEAMEAGAAFSFPGATPQKRAHAKYEALLKLRRAGLVDGEEITALGRERLEEYSASQVNRMARLVGSHSELASILGVWSETVSRMNGVIPAKHHAALLAWADREGMGDAVRDVLQC